MKRMRSPMKALAIGLGLLSVIGSDCRNPPRPEPPPKAEFELFGLSPSPICTNLGLPILRVSWKVKGGGASCLSNLKINGADVSGNVWDAGIQGGRCGEGEYTRETAFNLRDVFGNNIPSTITVSADLTRQAQAGVFVGTEVMDSASGTVTAQECQAGTAPGN